MPGKSVFGYLIDTSGLWHLLRTPAVKAAWEDQVAAGMIRACEPTRAEFLYSAKGPADRDEMAEELDTMCPPALVPKRAWRWVDMAQYKLTQRRMHRGPGVIDLLVCATAVHHDLTVLHVDDDFATVARVIPDLRHRDIRT